jgi:L-ribulokinase
MGGRDRDVYRPIPQNSAVYDQLFAEYTRLHDYFGRGGNEVMRRLRRIRRDALAREVGA